MRIPFSQFLKVMLLYIATRCKTGKMWRLFYKTWRGTPDAVLNTVKKCSQEIDREITRKGKERENSISPDLPLTQSKVSFLTILNFTNTILKSSSIFSIRSLVWLKRGKIIACKFLVRNPQKFWQQTRSLQNARTQYTRLALLLKTKTRS